MLGLFRVLSSNKEKNMPKKHPEDSVEAVLETLAGFLAEDCSVGSPNLILLQKTNTQTGLTTLEARIQFTVGALRLHKGSMEVQTQGCKCLSNFAISAEIVSQLIAADALPMVIEALERFWWDADLQRAACSALWNIARNNEARAILGVPAAKAIFHTLELHKGSDHVQEAALGSLANLSPNNEVQSHLCTEDKLHTIFLSMYTHKNCDLLQTAACGLLNNLAHGDKHALTIGQMGGIRLVVTAMRMHSHNGKLLRNACAALANLSTEAKNFKKLLRARALESLFYAYHCCPGNVPNLKDMARAALSNMGVRDLAFKTSSIHLAALNARGSLDAIVPMMEGKHTALYGDRRMFTFEENEDMNAQDQELNTPLHLAVERRDAQITKLLVARGADITIKNKYGQTIMDFIEKHIAEDEEKKANADQKQEGEEDDGEKESTGEELQAALVEGQRRFKVIKGVFADLVAKIVPGLPEDIAFLLADFAHMSDFAQHVNMDVAFEATDVNWTSFRRFLKREVYTDESPRDIEYGYIAQRQRLALHYEARETGDYPHDVAAMEMEPESIDGGDSHAALVRSRADSHRRSVSDSAAAGSGGNGTTHARNASHGDRALTQPKQGFRANAPPSIALPAGPEPSPAQQASMTANHCRRMSQVHPGMQGLYKAAFGDSVCTDMEDEESLSVEGPGGQKRARSIKSSLTMPRKSRSRRSSRENAAAAAAVGARQQQQSAFANGLAGVASGDSEEESLFEQWMNEQETVHRSSIRGGPQNTWGAGAPRSSGSSNNSAWGPWGQ